MECFAEYCLSVFFWPLYFVSFNLRLFITTLESSFISYGKLLNNAVAKQNNDESNIDEMKLKYTYKICLHPYKTNVYRMQVNNAILHKHI